MNLQLDHFSDDFNTLQQNPRACVSTHCFSPNPKQKSTFFAAGAESFFSLLHHGPNNVSRWMTWLPISLKNAAKCDKWYQLQNHSITESLNANGAWEKLFTSHPRACRISVSNKKTNPLFPFWSRGTWLFSNRAHIWTKCGHSHTVRLGASEFRKELDEPRKKQPMRLYRPVVNLFSV